jgi:hypothetical protein
LTDSEIQKVEGYLAHKWGLAGTLPASHPYKQSSTMQGPKDLNSYTTDLSNLVAGNTYYYRVAATNSEGTDWADQTASFVSKSKIDMSSGSLFFNTSGPTPSWSCIRWNRWKWSSPDPFLDGCPIQHHSIQGGQVLL